MTDYLIDLVRRQKRGEPAGIVSLCTANEFAIQASLRRLQAAGMPALIEATANQVDQNGGYTGMKPRDFVAMVQRIAKENQFPLQDLILGGDHLGPLTRANDPAATAMAYAEELVRDYVLAGFTKIHLDTSMRLADDRPDEPLSDEIIARRGAKLCLVAEEAYTQLHAKCPDCRPPVYIIGSEVPIPGGAQAAHTGIQVTDPAAARKTIAVYRDEFMSHHLEQAWTRVIGLVVQPGVEFGHRSIDAYDRVKATDLIRTLSDWPQGLFEGHSTDYQTPRNLRAMVQDGIAILKVGPALTFALREALYALELIEQELYRGDPAQWSQFRKILDQRMVANPGNWQKHYQGDADAVAFDRAFSLSDRARYYLNDSVVSEAIAHLIANLDTQSIPLALLSQYMPMQYLSVREGRASPRPRDLILDRIGNCVDDYIYAISGGIS